MTVATITALDCGWLRTQERTLIGGGSTEAIEIPVPAWLVGAGWPPLVGGVAAWTGMIVVAILVFRRRT